MANIISTTDADHQRKFLEQNGTATSSEVIGLDHCAPIQIDSPGTTSQCDKTRIVSKPLAQYFTAFDQVIFIACVIERIRNDKGTVIEEIYYPVPRPLQRRLCIPVRPIAFHPCYAPDGPFIFAHKLDYPGGLINSWNKSIRELLAMAKKQWVSVFPDKASKIYEGVPVPSPFKDEPDYPDFEEDLEEALAPNIISDLDHPAIQRILFERERFQDHTDLMHELSMWKRNDTEET